MVRTLRALINRTFRRNQIQARIKSLGVDAEAGAINAVFEGTFMPTFAREIAKFFDKAGGVNYVEFNVLDVASMRNFKIRIEVNNE